MDPCFCRFDSGLCNNMFQVATGYAHCRRNGFQLRLPLEGNRYSDSYFHQYLAMKGNPVVPGRIWNEPRFSYVPIPPDTQNLVGYFQSSKYFADVSGEIRALFALPTHLQDEVARRHATLLTPSLLDHGVIVHIRRGDYNYGQNKIKHGFLDERYYQRAIAAAQDAIPGCQFLVCSDDLEWCRKQPWLTDVGAIFVDEPSDVLALWFMSRFRNFIIANSTFSWWAVWLGDAKMRGGQVWAPDRWFGPTGPQDYQDVYEPDWVRLPIV